MWGIIRLCRPVVVALVAVAAFGLNAGAALADFPIGHLDDGAGLCLDDYGW
jgi:hypothetical protein